MYPSLISAERINLMSYTLNMSKETIIKEGLNNIKIFGGVVLLAVVARALADKLWTDHDTHDPGKTEMDILAYTIDDEGIDHRYYRQRKHKKD